MDDITKRREPLPALNGIYFITPTDESIKQLITDFSLGTMPQYKTAYVYLSGRPSRQQIDAIRECQHLVSRLKCLKEVNLEYLVVDRRTFTTHAEDALQTFFGASVDSTSSYRQEIDILSTRLASVFITLKVSYFSGPEENSCCILRGAQMLLLLLGYSSCHACCVQHNRCTKAKM